ncbi:hypothetical protein EON64_19915, partial [archaeon]
PKDRGDSGVAAEGEGDGSTPTSWEREMRSVLSALRRLPATAPFLLPVDPRQAPGYLEAIPKPMDLSTLENRLDKGLYRKQAAQFIEDLDLIWSNCITYNASHSDIVLKAEQCAQHSAELLRAQPGLGKLLGSSSGVAKQGGVSGHKEKEKVQESIKEEEKDEGEEEEGDGDDDHPMDEDAAEGEAAEGVETGGTGKVAGKRRYQTHRVRLFKSVLKQVTVHPLWSSLSHLEASKARDVLSLTDIKQRAEEFQETPLRFLEAIVAFFAHVQRVTEVNSTLHQAATQLQAFATECFKKTFPSVQKRQYEEGPGHVPHSVSAIHPSATLPPSSSSASSSSTVPGPLSIGSHRPASVPD